MKISVLHAPRFNDLFSLTEVATTGRKITGSDPVKLLLTFILWTFIFPGFFVASLRAADLVKARDALEHDDYSTALDIAKTACAEDPQNPEAWIVRGHALSIQIDHVGVFRKAELAKQTLAAYMRAAAIAPSNSEAHVSLLEYYRRAPGIVGGSRAKAREEAQRLIGLDPGLGYSWAARLAGEDNRSEDAFAACEALLRSEPMSYRSHYWLGATCVLFGSDLARGESALRHAIELTPGEDDPGLDEANIQLGRLLEMLGNRAGAVAAYRAALVSNPKSAEARARLERVK